MVISCIGDGLGNQLFQYAAGRALSLRLKTDLKLDLSWFAANQKRVYKLGHFNIEATSTTPFDDLVTRFWLHRKPSRLARFFRAAGLPIGVISLSDTPNGFNEQLSSVFGDVFLRGFWQSERYFEPVADIIRKELTICSEPDAENQTFLDQIHATESVAFHIRRGDYVTDPWAKVIIGTCDLDYYRRAVEKLLSDVHGPHFFVFSDDPEWARKNIRLNAPCTYISHNNEDRDFEDLRLMSHCKHFITANSTFSWWGAWLGTHPGKRVICPQQWFADKSKVTSDLIPDRWMRV